MIIKRKTLENLTDRGLYPYSKFYLSGIKKAEGGYWKNHFSTIGIIGMNEALLNLFGTTIADPEGQEFAVKVLSFMRDRLADFQEETGEIFNLEATPAEGRAIAWHGRTGSATRTSASTTSRPTAERLRTTPTPPTCPSG